MDKIHYDEMLSSLKVLLDENILKDRNIYLFGHCNATEELIELLMMHNFVPKAIIDNNINKQGDYYNSIPIVPPHYILSEDKEHAIVLIVARAYEAMAEQLVNIGYRGVICKLVDYNSYAEYSLEDATIHRMKMREERGELLLMELKKKYPGAYRILCPFSALGDIYIMMSYLPAFMSQRNIDKCVIAVVGDACAQVVKLFGNYEVECLKQKEMDEVIQAALYIQDKDSFIAHQDRPYVVDLYKALYVKMIPLELMYCCGVFGLPKDTLPVTPICFEQYPQLDIIDAGKSVILSPYAKSVTNLSEELWIDIVNSFVEKGYKCYTNVIGNEKPLEGTIPISPRISEMKSVVESAGTFVGIRSGLCDVIRNVKAKKIALYPDYNYCDTKWKAIDIYYLDDWDNRVVRGDFVWKMD